MEGSGCFGNFQRYGGSIFDDINKIYLSIALNTLVEKVGISCRVRAAMGLFALRTVFNWNDPIEICVAEIWMTPVYRQRPCRTIARGDADIQPQRRPEMNRQQSQPQVQLTFVLCICDGCRDFAIHPWPKAPVQFLKPWKLVRSQLLLFRTKQ